MEPKTTAGQELTTERWRKTTNGHIYSVTRNKVGNIIAVFNTETQSNIPLDSRTVRIDMINRKFRRFERAEGI